MTFIERQFRPVSKYNGQLMQEVKFYYNYNWKQHYSSDISNYYTSGTVHTDEELILFGTSASVHSIQTKNDICIATLKK